MPDNFKDFYLFYKFYFHFFRVVSKISLSKSIYKFKIVKHLKVKIDKLEISWVEILKNIDITINSNDRICLVGPNGAWKTTLLKVLTWEMKSYDGHIDNIWNISIGYLHQVYSDNEEKTVREELASGFDSIQDLEDKIIAIESQMTKDPTNMELIDSYTSLLEQFNNIGWNDYNNKIHGVANGMWILKLLDKKLLEISWWQRTKVALAKVLLESPDILFLDEPTNFIDMKSVEWLESFLQNKWKWWYVIISHDREFLDKTCSKTYEVQPNRPLTFYHCNYSDYVQQRSATEKKKVDNYKREQEFIDKEEKLINRFRAWSRAWWAKSRGKALEKMEKMEQPYIPKKPKFFFDFTWEHPEKILSFKECFIGRKEPLFYIQESILYAWQRIWIVWENWAWKSTFLKSIVWELPILDWFYSKWKWVKISYYSQMHEELDKNKTIKENFEIHWLHYPEQHLIAILTHYLFDRADIDKKVSDLSWGQTSKLLFAILWQKDCSLLILDEPTNHLDYDTRESLEESLRDFKWTLLFISHDRYFVNKLSTNIWFISDWELSISYWNYEDYKYKQDHNIDMDVNIFDEEAQMNLVLEEKLWEKEVKRLQTRFGKWKKRRR